MDIFTRAGKTAEACGYTDEAEELILKKIQLIQEDYVRAIKPYMDDLIRLRNMRTTPLKIVSAPFCFSLDDISEGNIEALVSSNHDHRCYCGEASVVPHKVGTLGCKRFLVDLHESPIQMTDTSKWMVEGELISWTTLTEQRGYYMHPCACWSRWKGSSNSLEEK